MWLHTEQLQGRYVRRAVKREKLKDSARSLAIKDIYGPGQAVEIYEEETIRLEATQTHGTTQNSIVLPFCQSLATSWDQADKALPCPPHPTMGQLISQIGSEDLVKEAAKKRMRVRGSDHCPFLVPHPPAPALHGRLSDEGQDSTPLWREGKPGVPHPPAPHQRRPGQEEV